MRPSDVYLDECMKILKRFLKERGKFKFMMFYLFKMGRDKRQFYYSVKQLYEEFNMDFGDVLHMRPTLGPGDRKFSWQMYVQTLSDEFKFYFRQHKWKIKVPFEENKEH